MQTGVSVSVSMCMGTSTPIAYSTSFVGLALTLVLLGTDRISWCGQKCLLELGWMAIESLMQKGVNVESNLDLKVIKEKLAEVFIHCISTGTFRLPRNFGI